MPVSHVSKVFAVKDAKIAKLLTDVPGSAPTYDTSIDVPGIKSVTIGGDVSTAELRGDNTRLDFQSVLAGVEVEFEYAKLSLDALNVFLGSTITDAGTTPNQTATLNLLSSHTPQYFRFSAQAVGADPVAGDVTLTLAKCILSEFPELGMAEEDYQTFSVTAASLPILGTPNGTWMSVAIRETAAALT